MSREARNNCQVTGQVWLRQYDELSKRISHETVVYHDHMNVLSIDICTGPHSFYDRFLQIVEPVLPMERRFCFGGAGRAIDNTRVGYEAEEDMKASSSPIVGYSP